MRKPMPHAHAHALPFRAAAALLMALLLVACAGAPVPPITWLRMPVDAAGSPTPATPAATAAPVASEVWQLMAPLPLPGHLDRDSLFVPQGAGGAAVRMLAGARWVEPLREAVPRLLREDLTRQLGARPLWTAPLPPGLVPARQLRVEITAFEIAADGKALVTRARWSLADARGARAPTVHEAAFDTPASASASAATEPEAWALAHRQAIATLAARIAATMSSAP